MSMTKKRTRLSVNNDESYYCGICMQIMHDPCYLNTDECSCRRSFCHKCLAKWASDETKCPHCAINFVTTAEIVRSCRQWSDFCDGVFRCCPHGPSGTCNKFKGGDYASLESHVTTCPHQKIRCQNDECGQMITRKHMKEHVRLCRLKRCPNAVKSCSGLYGCGFIGTKSEVAQHKTKCVFSPEAITQIKRLTSAATTS
jgi:hypothetical protein